MLSERRYTGRLPMMSEMDSSEYGRILIEIGTALLQGRLQIVDGQPLTPPGTRPNGSLQHEPSHVSNDHSAGMGMSSVVSTDVVTGIPHAGRPGARGQWSARKGYHVAKGWKKISTDGVTPAGTRLLEYLEKKPNQSAQMIAGELGFARKTVENLLSILRQRHLVEAGDLK
jgi:hypothetical protein